MSTFVVFTIVTAVVLLANRRLKSLTLNLEQRIHKLQKEEK